MDDLLPHYERELAFLRTRAADFAQRYPKIAGRLQLSGDVGDDPHVERLMESFALLSARIHKRLDDDFPLFTEALLEVLYPHYLRPFPSCAVARFDLSAQALQMSQPAILPRGTELTSRPVKGVPCRFRTSQATTLLPLRVASVSFRHALGAPAGTPVPPQATSVLSITLDKLSPALSWSAALSAPLRIYLDGEASQVSALREALCRQAVGVMWQTDAGRPWRQAAGGAAALPQGVGFAEDEALIDWDDRSHPAYRLLSEYFAFPDKFQFVDLPALFASPAEKDAAGEGGAASRLTVHVLVAGLRADADASRLLEAVAVHNVVLGAAPVVNLFRQAADPIRITHQQDSHAVVVDGRRAHGHEVHALERVYRVRQTAHGDMIDEVKPFFSLQHGALLADDGLTPQGAAVPSGAQGAGLQGAIPAYWQLHRDEDLAERSPGHELMLTLVDANQHLTTPAVETLSLDVLATNRDLPHLLAPCTPGGDLFMSGGGPAREVVLLRKPTRSHRVHRGKGMLWRLISHLSLNHLLLTGGGIDALKELLRLYDLPHSLSNRRQVEALVAIEFKPDTAWLPGEPFATFVRGTEVRLTVDEQGFVGTGLGLFATVLDHFFGLYVHINSYARLTVLSARTHEELIACPPRHGARPLL
ncbi:type VI secretion system baseplate subunit TssF [Aquabacterium sp.]|uniref:type VI secretion system baseplate subunit TssF n=1 Tax=Aquabacterium sp. TaxID=1872578 RepID=UPI00248754B0|nr:type VI secretion system baseplate subunit TssF [Aquabacterium sp.]MDI1349757.1 type VI secretion system baseplate subunit TssF [Aquabacterium sp.]